MIGRGWQQVKNRRDVQACWAILDRYQWSRQGKVDGRLRELSLPESVERVCQAVRQQSEQLKKAAEAPADLCSRGNPKDQSAFLQQSEQLKKAAEAPAEPRAGICFFDSCK